MKSRPLIGSKLANFQVKRLLGRGGMADVYYGWDEKLHRPVAIKIFEVETRAKTTEANRFIQEARVMAKWRHDNIVQIYYAGDETGLFYYVMEYVDGYDLASIMSVYADKDELMPIEDVVRIGRSLASALDYAHMQGVIHRDVKPANVMIADDDRVILGDFGLALDLSNKSQGEVFGSPHYIAPEQARRSSDAVPQSDLYSLGVILYEMLTGATPFNDPSPASLALQHITEAPPLPRSINPALSESVEAVLLKALNKMPADRYQSGEELMDALDQALVEKPAAQPVNASSLPPIPVNAPTIQRSNIPLSSFTKRRDVADALAERVTTIRHGMEDKEPAPQRPSKKGFAWAVALLLLLLVLYFGLNLRPDLRAALLQGFISPVTTASTELSSLPIVQASPTNSPLPAPTSTSTLAVSTPTASATATASPSLTATPIQEPTKTATAMPVQSPTAAASSTPTIAYPNGYLMTAYYNQNTFFLHDMGEASRSLSGFSFERVNNDGTFENYFDGWEWETYYVKTIQPNRCVSLKVLDPRSPHLLPDECNNRTLSILSFIEGNDRIFWTPNDLSREFRVLWLDEEIARCSIAAGICTIYVP